MVITTRPRPDTPGVALATWRDDEDTPARCVLVHAGVAAAQWQQLADVVVCQPQRSRAAADHAVSVVLEAFPGCTVVAAEWEQQCTVVLRGLGELTFRTGDGVRAPVVCAVWCYAWVVSSGFTVDSSNVSSRA